MIFLLWVLATFGFAYVIGAAKISLPVREAFDRASTGRGLVRWCFGFVLALIECPACVSFWVGLFTVQFWLNPAPEQMPDAAWRVFGGLVLCATSLILASVVYPRLESLNGR